MRGRRATDLALPAVVTIALHAGVIGMMQRPPVPDKPHPPEVVTVALLVPPPHPRVGPAARLSPAALHLDAPRLAFPPIRIKAIAPTADRPAPGIDVAGPGTTAAKGPPDPTPSDDIDPMVAYLALLRERIQARLIYPPAARRLHLTGQVTLSLQIAADGRLDTAGLAIVDDKADAILKAAAIATLKDLATVPPPPQGPIRLLVPILFTSPS
jgi:TonB family protein